MYPEFMIAGMREELTRLGVAEARTPAAVDEAATKPGTTLVVVNSVCGCAAGKARPGLALALQQGSGPDRAITVFAGADIAATERARSYFSGYLPSSPSMGLLKDGKLVYMLERREIEGRAAPEIAQMLAAAFAQHCAVAPVKQ